ncbi:peptidase M42 [Paenibacillus sp. IITD108]|uniref:peptidase M42 n=1 Tax=Paenibacillus sp. IITD108 TaxID=3116649 RepID=UPI002F41ED49
MDEVYYDYMIDQFKKILSIDSISGDYEEIQEYITDQINKMGYEYELLNKGGIIATLGGTNEALAITAHADTLGLMIKNVNKDGSISLTPIGRLPEYAVENENVRVKTHTRKIYTGTIRRKNSCIHVTPLDERSTVASYSDNLVLYLDEPVANEKDVEALGILCGDIVSLEPRLVLTDNGYIKCRFLDDKINVAILLTYMHFLKKENQILKRKIYAYFSMHEEIMHGGACGFPKDTEEILALDVGCVAPLQNSSEYKVTICAADSRFPYNRKSLKKLIDVANDHNISYTLDIFTPTYGTDADLALLAGYDVRHSLIGPGVVGTHSYERTHKLSLINTFDLLNSYAQS